jgi:flagellar motor switch protein FliM
LRDLSEAWRSVADITFAVKSLASEPQLLHVLAPAEAVIVIAFEVRVESTSGLMSLAIPSIFIKRLRNKFDQLNQVRKAESTEADQLHIAQLLRHATLEFDAEIEAGTISTRSLLDLNVDDVLMLDHPVERKVAGRLNGRDKWLGEIVSNDGKMLFRIAEDDHRHQW